MSPQKEAKRQRVEKGRRLEDTGVACGVAGMRGGQHDSLDLGKGEAAEKTRDRGATYRHGHCEEVRHDESAHDHHADRILSKGESD